MVVSLGRNRVVPSLLLGFPFLLMAMLCVYGDGDGGGLLIL